ncbi:MAG: hypothetical protein ACXVCS_17135 [Bdellovibrionota bacterium]
MKLRPRQLQKNGERGSIALAAAAIVLAMLAGGIFMMSQNSINSSSLASAKQKFRADLLASKILTNVKAAITNYPAAANCLPPQLSQAALEPFRKYSAAAAPLTYSSTAPFSKFKCLYDDDDTKILHALKVTITELAYDPNGLYRNLNISVDVTLNQARNTIYQTVRLSRDFRLRVVSLSNFGILFSHNPTGSFVTAPANVHMNVFTSVLFADPSSPSWDQLQPPIPANLTYNHYVYSRFGQIQSSPDINVSNFRTSYIMGIQTGVLQAPFATAFLPDKSIPAWDYRFDNKPLYGDVSFPIPEFTDSSGAYGAHPTAAVCDSSSNVFDSVSANSVEVPDAQSGPFILADTCASGSRPQVLLFNRASKNFTVDMTSHDSNFCGLIVADTLTVNIDNRNAPGIVYGLIGHFFVNQIIVNTTDPTIPVEVRAYNPEEPTPLDGIAPLPSGQSLGNLASTFKTLASSTAWNYYLPIAASPPAGTPFKLQTPADYLVNCPAINAYTYQQTYPPMQNQPGYGAYQADAAGALYSMESL